MFDNMVELGIYSVRKGYPISEPEVNHIFTTSLTAVSENASIGKIVTWGSYYYDGPGTSPQTEWPITNLEWVKSRFDLYTTNKNTPWTYGTYLGTEEVFHPSIQASWWPNPNGTRYYGLSTWTIDGELTLYGINVKALKPWYIQKYGSWNQSWWDNTKAANGYNNSIIKEWSLYYARQLYEMWHLHMRELGKKSAVLGYIGIPETKTGASPSNIQYSWGTDLHNYIMNNYDMIVAYQYPECISGCQKGTPNPVPENPDHIFHSNRDISWSAEAAQVLRSQFKGKLDWILTAHWGDSVGTADKDVQLAEYKAVLPYVDIISLPEFTNMYKVIWPGTEPSAPRLAEFYQLTELPSQCDFDTEIFLPSIGCVPRHYLIYGGLGFSLLILLR